MSESTLDSLTVHFKAKKEICIVHGSLCFFKDIIHWAGGFNTDKQRSFEKYIMTHHGINIRKIPRNGTDIVRYIDFSDGSGSLGSLNTCIARIKMLRNSRLVNTLSILMNWGIFLLLVISNGNCESRQFTKQYFFLMKDHISCYRNWYCSFAAGLLGLAFLTTHISFMHIS